MRSFLVFGLLCIADAIGGTEFKAASADNQGLFAAVVLAGLIMDAYELFIKEDS